MIDKFKEEVLDLIKYKAISQPMARYDYTPIKTQEVNNDKK